MSDLGSGDLMKGVVLHRTAESSLTARRETRAVDMDVAVLDEDVDHAQRVLLAEPQAAEASNTHFGAGQRQAGHQRVCALGTTELVGLDSGVRR